MIHRLEVCQLSVRRGRRLVIDGVSFRDEAGAVVGLLGPNGAGKTTLLSALAQLVPKAAGSVSVDGHTSPAELRKAVALIPEIPSVFPLLTVWEHLEFVARSLRAEPSWRNRAESLLERFGLSAARNVVGAELSKGTRQKTLIAASVLAAVPVYRSA